MPSFARRPAPQAGPPGEPIDLPPYTIDEALRDCLEEVSRTTPKSHRVYSFHVKAWLALFSGRQLTSIKASDIERAFAAWAAHVKPATISHRYNLIRRVFKQAIRDDRALVNPCLSVQRPKVKNARDRFLTLEEEERLRHHLSPRDYRIVRLALGTGLRRGELFGLRVENCDFSGGFVHVEKTKTGVPRRVPMNPEVRGLLTDLCKGKRPADLLLPHHPPRWVQTFRTVLEKAKIRNFRFHDLRHTFATRLVAAGVHIREIQELMGHSNIVQTQRYSHVSPGHLLKAVNRLPGSQGEAPAPPPESAPAVDCTSPPRAPSPAAGEGAPPVYAVQAVPKWMTDGLEALIRIVPKLESQVRRLRQESRSLRAEMKGLRAEACIPSERLAKPPGWSTAERAPLIAWMKDARERFGLSWGEIAKRLNSERIGTARGCRWTAARVLAMVQPSPSRSVMRPPAPALAARLQELRAGGMTYRGIAQCLNEEGIPTIKGGKWSFALVYRVMHHSAAPGPRTEPVPVASPPRPSPVPVLVEVDPEAVCERWKSAPTAFRKKLKEALPLLREGKPAALRFSEWLVFQISRSDQVGDLARLMDQERQEWHSWSLTGWSLPAFRTHLERRFRRRDPARLPAALDALEVSWREWLDSGHAHQDARAEKRASREVQKAGSIPAER